MEYDKPLIVETAELELEMPELLIPLVTRDGSFEQLVASNEHNRFMGLRLGAVLVMLGFKPEDTVDIVVNAANINEERETKIRQLHAVTSYIGAGAFTTGDSIGRRFDRSARSWQ